MTLEEIKKILPTIPHSPGCYQYRNADGTIIYVGKAKDLRNRVSSYFNSSKHNRKTTRLVSEIRQVEYFVVGSEAEALVLENNLIKTHLPKYNILLKDDKTYPKIVITREPFPRIFTTRQEILKGTSYGPYPSVQMARTVVDLIHRLLRIRSCRHTLTPEVVRERRVPLCLQYHIKKCDAPCQGRIDAAAYDRLVEQAHRVLKGEISMLIDEEMEQMEQMSEQLEFERAEQHRQNIDLLRRYSGKHVVAPGLRHELDVFAYDEDDEHGFLNMMHLHHGAVILAHNVAFRKQMDTTRDELLPYLIGELRSRFHSTAREVILAEDPHWTDDSYTVTVPQRGEKKQLLELSTMNVRRHRADYYKREEKLNPEQRTTRLMQTMQRDLAMDRPPRHIECFDNSNIQGTNPVAACVVFRNGKPSKKDYRKFHVKTVVGPDDYRTMREIIYRRYRKVLDEGEPLPDLIIVDGGKGQLRVAYETLRELGMIDRVRLLGLAERYEELYQPHDPDPIVLDKRSETQRVVQHIRDEAHRFGITFHRDTRSKAQIKSILDEIPGIGPRSREALLARFKTPLRVAQASRTELIALLGTAKGHRLYRHLHPEADDSAVD